MADEVKDAVAKNARGPQSARDRRTVGCDGLTMAAFERDLAGDLRRLAEDLKARTFRPHPALSADAILGRHVLGKQAVTARAAPGLGSLALSRPTPLAGETLTAPGT